MNDIETLNHMIIEFYKTYRSRMDSNNNFHGATVYRSHYPKKLDSDKINEVLVKINDNNCLSLINAETLNIACIINLYYEDFYKIMEYLFISHVLKEENKYDYYLIKLNIFNVINESFHYKDAIENKIDINKYFYKDLEMKNYYLIFENNIPINMKAKYGLEVQIMTKLLIIIYATNYNYDLAYLNNILLDFINCYDDEMKINGINSWFLNNGDRKTYISFLEHYLNNSLNNKKMIK